MTSGGLFPASWRSSDLDMVHQAGDRRKTNVGMHQDWESKVTKGNQMNCKWSIVL